MGRRRQKWIRQFHTELQEIDAKISDLEQQLELLNAERRELWQKSQMYETAENTAQFLKSIFSVNENNSMVERLYKDTKTTPIIEKYYYSDKQFLVFPQIFRVAPSWKYVSLVVAKARMRINYSFTELTMTDLKKAAGTHISQELVGYMTERDRLYPLYRELLNIGQKDITAGGSFTFEKPCLLGGQKYSDQTGFGWEYNGSELVKQGKEFGETNKFMIIGVLIDS